MNFNNVTQSLRLREYYYMILRHKRWFGLSVTLCTLTALIFAFSLPKIYRAETVLLIEDEKILKPLISGLAISPSLSGRVRHLKEELLSWPRLTLLVEKLQLDKNIKDRVAYEKLIQGFRKNINVKLRGTGLVTLSYEGQHPKDCQRIVENLSEIILQGNITSVNLETNSAIRFIKDQLEIYRVNLEASETKLRKFREMYNSVLPVATRMNEQLVQLKIEQSRLLTENTEEHPRVIQSRKMIEHLERQRDEFMKKAKQSGVDIGEEDFGKLISSVPLQEQELTKLQRDYAVNDSVYQKLLQKLETAKISQTLEGSDNSTKFRILEPARLPLVPVKPNKAIFLLGGFMTGVALGALVIYLVEQSNDSIRSIQDAGQFFEKPIFGAIQRIRPEELILGQRLRSKAHV